MLSISSVCKGALTKINGEISNRLQENVVNMGRLKKKEPEKLVVKIINTYHNCSKLLRAYNKGYWLIEMSTECIST